VSVQSASLHFRARHSCPNVELLVGTADWMKGYPDNTLVSGDPSPVAKFYDGASGPLVEWPSEGVSIDVRAVVNNWLNGEEHGGYANYGFVLKGGKEADLEYADADACVGRFWDFSLTVDYTYDKESPPKKTPDTYPLVCRGTEALKVGDVDGPVGSRWVGFTFIPGTKPANAGLLPGQCSWQDRGMRPGEPGRRAQPIEGAVAWIKDLNSSDSYWTFNVYNAGGQLQATSAERNKRMLVPLPRTNFALAANKAKANASTAFPGYAPSGTIDGDRKGLNGGKDGYWSSSTGTFPQWLEVDFDGSKTINEIDVFTVQDDYTSPLEPNLSTTFTKFGVAAFAVQYWNRFGAWVDVPATGNPVTGNMNVWKQFSFPDLKTSKIRVLVAKSPDGYSRLTEVEAWGK